MTLEPVRADLGLTRRAMLGSTLAAALVAALDDDAQAAPQARAALVYRGPAAWTTSSAAAVAALRHRSVVRPAYVGPSAGTRLTAASLRRATLYVQPGGGSVEAAWRHMASYRRILTSWVHGGGHYLGLCLGAYLAADDPGLGLWPGDIYDYKTARGSRIRSAAPQAATIAWRGRDRTMFVEDAPTFTVRRGVRRVSVLARYASGHIAAVSAPVGRGRVTLIGPHPEAPPSWYPRRRPARWDPTTWIDTERTALSP